ncbi:hypothetical protein PR002_g33262 [Phytophthora rubi]|uniref:Uncharacterized protein n=1 Tax=Phytophthora rubi TaxID=129364 RepID=A0A6A3G1G3_9STRA|nr:hypothetical protein PR002_g33262 [Phytophthora rubi]
MNLLLKFAQLQLLYTMELEEIVVQNMTAQETPLPAVLSTEVQCYRGMKVLLKFAQLQLLYSKELEEIVAQSRTAQETKPDAARIMVKKMQDSFESYCSMKV